MKQRTPNRNELALLSIIQCDSSELKKHSETVYSWRGIYFEVLNEAQFKRQKTKGSHYITHFYRSEPFKVREMGDKAKKVIKIKKGLL